MFISPRNSHEGQMNLFEKTDCSVIWFDASFRNVVQPWLQQRDMRDTMVSPVEHWFPEERYPHFPYDKSFDQARWDPMVVLHTSGTTDTRGATPAPLLLGEGHASGLDSISAGMLDLGRLYRSSVKTELHDSRIPSDVPRGN